MAPQYKQGAGRINGNGNGHRHWRSDEDAVARLAAVLQRLPSTCTAAVLAMVFTAALLLLLHPGVRYHARETAKAVMASGTPHSSSSTSSTSSSSSSRGGEYLKFSSDSSGFCRLDYTIKTWDGKNVRVCDPSLCAGREGLKELQAAAGSPKRWSAFHESAYMRLFNSNKLLGWLKPRQIAFVRQLSLKQHQLGIYGTVGEIGVHHGKFFIPIAGYSAAAEPVVAIDLYEDQGSNVDTSGRGSKAHLLHNLELSGIPEDSVRLIKANSMQLTAKNFTAWGLPKARLLSVDGGHTLEITLHDLMVASCIVREGGIVVLDDFPNPTWMGVAEALVHFAHAQDRLVPFLHGANKVWFTTPSYVQVYQEFFKTDRTVFPCTQEHVSKQTLAGHRLCWTGYN